MTHLSLQFMGCILLSIALSSWSQAEKTIKQAEKLYSEHLYSDAIELYAQAYKEIPEDEKLKMELLLQQATCYLRTANPHAALAVLSSLKSPLLRNQQLYLLSFAYRQLGDSTQAYHLLKHCSPSQESQLIALEQGYHLTRLGDRATASKVLSRITWEAENPLPYYLAQLQLAKIDLLACQAEAALEKLSLLSHSLPKQHPLEKERLYLTGWALATDGQYGEAAGRFNALLSSANISGTTWSIQALRGVVSCHLKQASTLADSDEMASLLAEAEKKLQLLISHDPSEPTFLLLSDFYQIKAKRLGDRQAYDKAKELFARLDRFSTPEGKREALLTQAEAAPTYRERTQLYEQLSTLADSPHSFLAKTWFLKGLNDYEEGLFEPAAQAFEHAIHYLSRRESGKIALAMKYQALSYAHQEEALKMKQAWKTILNLLHDPHLSYSIEFPQEIVYLAGWIAFKYEEKEALLQARTLLQNQRDSLKCPPDWDTRHLMMEGLICLKLKEWEPADAYFGELIDQYPSSPLRGDSWFWRGYGAEKQNREELKKEYFKKAYIENPKGKLAPIAYFHLYDYREYMQGDRKAIKHLQVIPLLFPNHPLVITAHYLMGLDRKKDRHSEEGQLLKSKDWTGAIEAFHLAETSFDAFRQKNLIPSHELPYFTQIRYRAQMERALANFAIAKAASGGKRQIYLEYAEEVFSDIIQDFINPQTPLAAILIDSLSPYPKVWAEAELKLAQIYAEKEKWLEAEEVLNRSLEHYRQAKMNQGYGLMGLWYEKGKIAQKRNQPQSALDCFIEAEKGAREGAWLSPNEKLNLWIQQSLCYQALHQSDLSMKLLSRVINEDVVSPLRIKAMFMRGELYEKEERPELAIRQFEAVARYGGEWGQKAQQKLEQHYGY